MYSLDKKGFNMELLYVWINISHNGIMQKQEFNFSPEYSFSLEEIDNHYLIKNKPDWKSKKSIYKSDVISNITAIVGKNGTGKTTLLEELFLRDGTPHTSSNEPEYEEYNQERTALAGTVLVYKINGAPEIFHNLKDVDVESEDGYRVFDCDACEDYEYAMNSPDGYAQTMRVYLSNSNYTSDTFSGLMKFSNLWRVTLSPTNLDFISKRYFAQLYHLDYFNEVSPPDRLRKWYIIVNKNRKTKDFQALCDILYFYKLTFLGKSQSYFAKINKTIEIDIDYPHHVIDDFYSDYVNYQSIEDVPFEQKWLYKIYKYSKSLAGDLEFYQDRCIRLIYIYLLLELSADSNNSDYTLLSSAKSLTGLKRCVNKHMDELMNCDWLSEEIDHIKELSFLISRMDKQTNAVPTSDGAFRSVFVVPDNNQKLFWDFITFIKNEYDRPNSIILRYMKFRFCGMSSGERAFQNFFSWLNLLTEFKKIDTGNSFELQKNIFLLIDEIDLYMHPEWQQKFIKNLVEEINSQFQGHTVQIVFATHSPLCLSDIPSENCIYLDKDNGEIKSIAREQIKQTFGRDIYTLLNDAFFMGNVSMGAFASDYIKRTIDRIDRVGRETTENEISEINEALSFIGNDLILRKLEQMLSNKAHGSLLSRKEYLEKELQRVKKAIEEQQ